jgi:HSP20 family protein
MGGTASLKKKESELNDQDGHLIVDVFKDGNDIVIQSALAGIDPKTDIDISISDDRVTISGQRRSDHEIKDSDFYHREIHWGSFSRLIILPEDMVF